jgi:hypothetical protein
MKLAEKALKFTDKSIVNDSLKHNLLLTPVTAGVNEFVSDNSKTALDVVYNFYEIKSKEDEIYILHRDDTPVGMLEFEMNHISSFLVDRLEKEGVVIDLVKGDKYVNEIVLAGFEQNSVTLVRDTLELVNKKLDELGLVRWTVRHSNPIKSAYDKIIMRYPNSKTFSSKGGCRMYFIARSELAQ